MRLAMLGFVIGAATLQTRAALPPQPASMLLLVLLVTVLTAAVIPNSTHRPRVLISLPAGVLTGFFWAALLAQSALAPQLAKADEGRDLSVVGVVDSLPYQFEQGVRFNFAVEKIIGDDAVVPPHISLSWYAGQRGAGAPVPEVRPGERWRLTVRLQRPHGNANPDGFDYEVWLLEQGLRATGYVRDDARLAEKNRRLDGFVFGIGRLVERGRGALREHIVRVLAGRPYAGVIVALVVGDQRAIGQPGWLVFNRTGISHLISISGLCKSTGGLFQIIK